VLACDRIIGSVLRHFYFRATTGINSQITYCIDSTSADILILGSSRANHSYVPEIIEEGLSLNCYNVGRDGSYILYNYAVFKAITKRYNPKIIIFDINPADIAYSANEYERLSLLLPYYKTHPEIRSIIDLRGPLEKVKHISSIYHFNSLIFQLIRDNIDIKKVKATDLKGYVPLYNKMAYERIDTAKSSIFTIDENKTNALRDIIFTCKERKINIVFVYSPIWRINQDTFLNPELTKLYSLNGIKYLDMSNLPVFISNPQYFADISHLNDEGARVFSAMLRDKLQFTY
jgi:hypothetical protein